MQVIKASPSKKVSFERTVVAVFQVRGQPEMSWQFFPFIMNLFSEFTFKLDKIDHVALVFKLLT